MPEPYRQILPALELSIERYTDAVPDDGRWYLFKAGRQLGRYRTLKEAQSAWQDALEAAGWAPKKRSVDATELRRREQKERWARNRAG